MIISKTPIRISFLGGGTDYPEYFSRRKGAVLGTAINKYSYITLKETHRFFDYNYRISYSKSELAENIKEIKHPSVKACLQHTNINNHLELNYIGDWPARTGLGSSSSFTVGLLKAIYAFRNKNISKQKLAKEAIYVEREVIKENVGWQDQIWASYGGMAIIEMEEDRFKYEPITISKDRKRDFLDHLLLFYTGIKRFANDILDEQIKKTKKTSNDRDLSEMCKLVYEGKKILYNGNLHDFGKILHENWLLKKSLSTKITNPEIDRMYKKAITNGALGGKLLGAGGGGFVLFFVPPNKHSKIIKALSDYPVVDFKFDNNGSSIIYYQNR